MDPKTKDPTNGHSDPSPCAASAAGRPGYGAHPKAHAAISAFAERVHEILPPPGTAVDADAVVSAVAEALRPVLAVEDLLDAAHREGRPDWYRKHILYACPEGRFTLLALVWLPGQGTVIHGHTAWGAVGVYEGTPNVAVYECSEGADGRHAAVETKDIRCGPGDLATVRPGLCDVHRIYNATNETMITLHAYGLDLIADPDAINLNLNL
jgi:predicted metal-dependent enzyme (double-stranded beta helix superfamily)